MKWIRDMSLKYKLPFLYTTSLIILCVASYLIYLLLSKREWKALLKKSSM